MQFIINKSLKIYCFFLILVLIVFLNTSCIFRGSDNDFDEKKQYYQSMVDLRADVNRDGVIDFNDPTDDENEDTWDATHGAIFLANIDDDQCSCPGTGWDALIASCNDAADDIVNGAEDLLDMARLKTRPWPDIPSGTTGYLKVEGIGKDYIRLFLKNGGNFEFFNPNSDRLDEKQLQKGCEFAVEGKDIVRDRGKWNGFVNFVFIVSFKDYNLNDTIKDRVRMRVAPLILSHHLNPPVTVYAAPYPIRDDSETFYEDLKTAVSAAGIKNPVFVLNIKDRWSQDVKDRWAQDYMETAYMSMPVKNGMHVIRVNIRSANIYKYGERRLPRKAGCVVFTVLRGPDVAGVQQYDLSSHHDRNTLNSMGNTETIPPYKKDGINYPLGRIIRGKTLTDYPDRSFTKMLEAQAVQPLVYIDTSWLSVGHVDETITFLRADNQRGWTIAVNDPLLAKKMLQTQRDMGNGDVLMFQGLTWFDDEYNEYSAEVSITEVLENPDVMGASAEAVIAIADQLNVIKSETGIKDNELLKVPFLHFKTRGKNTAFQIGTVNGISLGDYHFGAPNPHGPVIDGVDIMKEQLENEFAKLEITVHWIENWYFLHLGHGEVHCGTNTTREVPKHVKWWESGR